jgi:hypothetical protein
VHAIRRHFLFHLARLVERTGALGLVATGMLGASFLLAGYAVAVQHPALHDLNARLQLKSAEFATALQASAGPGVDGPAPASSADLALLLNRSAQEAAVQLADLALEHASPAARDESRGSIGTRAVVRATGSYAQLKRFQALVLNADPHVALLDLSLAKAGNVQSRLEARYTFVHGEGGLVP